MSYSQKLQVEQALKEMNSMHLDKKELETKAESSSQLESKLKKEWMNARQTFEESKSSLQQTQSQSHLHSSLKKQSDSGRIKGICVMSNLSESRED